MPVHNGSLWLEEGLSSVINQTYQGSIQLSVYDDASTDGSRELIERWRQKLKERNIELIISGADSDNQKSRGEQLSENHHQFDHILQDYVEYNRKIMQTLMQTVGYAKNKAIAQSAGKYLCFLDADDVMHPDRISCQILAAMANPNAIVGCQFHREPAKSTQRYTQWANTLTSEQLLLQVYTSHGPTVIMPTWFCSRNVIGRAGGFDESGKGTPEDLLLFHHHLELGGDVVRVDKDLLMYRYHPDAETFSISEETIWNHRLKFLEERVLCHWDSFSVWNAGKQGRKLYRSLSLVHKKKVTMFCDVDDSKIKKGYYIYEESKETPKPKIPIVHFSAVKPPIVICVKLGLSGNFEENLQSLGLTEGTDYVHFN